MYEEKTIEIHFNFYYNKIISSYQIEIVQLLNEYLTFSCSFSCSQWLEVKIQRITLSNRILIGPNVYFQIWFDGIKTSNSEQADFAKIKRERSENRHEIGKWERKCLCLCHPTKIKAQTISVKINSWKMRWKRMNEVKKDNQMRVKWKVRKMFVVVVNVYSIFCVVLVTQWIQKSVWHFYGRWLPHRPKAGHKS